MSWTEWLAFKHAVLIHVPVAIAVLLVLPLFASLRPGRGMRPWWLVCRYLAWINMLFLLIAGVSGFLLAQQIHLLAPGVWLAPQLPAASGVLRLHQMLAAASLLLGVLLLRLLFRKRLDHQSLGILPVLVGLLWSAALVGTAWQGMRMSRPVQVEKVVVKEQMVVPAAPVARAATAEAFPTKLLDFASLEPIQKEPVKTTVHGVRWIRTWVTPAAAEAYRAGQPLPPGSVAVLQSFEDRWGRPGPEPGPLYGLEVQPDGKALLSFYWGRVPEARRAEVGGVERAWWTRDDAHLGSCMACHAQGLAPIKDRSTRYPLRKPKDDAVVSP